MFRLLIFLWVIVVNFELTNEQSMMINGRISDGGSNAGLEKVSMGVLSAKDSMLVVQARSNLKGNFTIRGLRPGEYLILFSHPQYVELFVDVSLDSNSMLI